MEQKSGLRSVDAKVSFVKEEETVLQYWADIKAFETSLERNKDKPLYTFYDGPPFATGLPHYGHILAGTIKDTVTRYAHQTGHSVSRRFGWDCHGLPVEYEIDNMLGIKGPKDVEAMGIAEYNKKCRSIVSRYSNEWEVIVKRMGRWIDFAGGYKTLDANFMESVWWVFKQLYDKGYVYRGFKVMPYSTACTTPLSNFEANQAYREVQDPSVVVSFPLLSDDAAAPVVRLVAWTTTPWTLPSNLALCVNADMDYIKVEDSATGTQYIVMEARIEELFKTPKKKPATPLFKVLDKFKGAALVGKKYEPLFDYYAAEADKAFRVIADPFVSADSGTGVVHCAPAFGEDDYRVCKENGIITTGESIPCPVDDSGCFIAPVVDWLGIHVKAADAAIIKALKLKGRVISAATISHQYPFCWRSDTPLIYKAVPSWFVRVTDRKDDLLENNRNSYWVPGHVREKRFHNWLENARDWSISRNRYWGTPIPIWANADFSERIVVGSIEELAMLSGVRITDLHRENVDHITIPSPSGNGVLRRVKEVFDCWFESGSMPYGQLHYPFENKDIFDKGFPADFIAEGIDQTRGWFYTLLVISTMLFDKPPFKNLIVNGLVLAGDGKKMSKRLKNYPDPVEVVNEFGADSVRLYLINSPVVRAEDLKFQKDGVKAVVRDVFLPWFNAYRFFTENALAYERREGHAFVPSMGQDADAKKPLTNVMDRWVLAACQSLIEFVRTEMDHYRLYTVVPKLLLFIDQLTNWYVRFNRKRIKGAGGEADCHAALSTLFDVLFTLCSAMAPFTPFFVETLYLNLSRALPVGHSARDGSVHFLPYPVRRDDLADPRTEEAVSRMQTVIELGRLARDRKAIPTKFPLRSVKVVHRDAQLLADVGELSDYIKQELNVRDVELVLDDGQFTRLRALPDNDVLGPRLKRDSKTVSDAIRVLSSEQLIEFQEKKVLNIAGHDIHLHEIKVIREFKGDATLWMAEWDVHGCLVMLDLVLDQTLREEGLAREVANRVQRLRKKAGLTPDDHIQVFYTVTDDALAAAIHNQAAFLQQSLKLSLLPSSARPAHCVTLLHAADKIESSQIEVSLCRATLSLSRKSLAAKALDERFVALLELHLACLDYASAAKSLTDAGKLAVKIDAFSTELHLGSDIFLTTAARFAAEQ